MEHIMLETMPWTTIVISAVLMFAVLAAWVLVQHRTNPTWGTIDEPDATAYVKGSCGDAMKISLRFRDGRVVDAKYWTDGCRMSNECGAAAARLALNKSPEELMDVSHLVIEHEVGTIPEEDRHCATLAAGALHECVKTFVLTSDEADLG
jgi:nitrogen fixation NifU-like protein